MTTDGLFTARNGRRVTSLGVLEGPQAPAPGASKRTSRGFFSLFSSSKRQSQPRPPQPSHTMNPTFQRAGRVSYESPLQALPERFDHISLTSPLQRNDPAFSADPALNPSFIVAPPPRDFIRSSAAPPPPAPPTSQPNFQPIASQQFRYAELQEKARYIDDEFPDNLPGPSRHRYETNYSSSESSVASPSNKSSPVISGHDLKSVSSSSSFLSGEESGASTPTQMPPSKLGQESEGYQTNGVSHGESSDSKNRPLSPPPEYEPIETLQEMLASEIPTQTVPPRPTPPRNDSAPELHHIEPPILPHRSATTPVIGSAPSASGSRRPSNDNRLLAYDLDRIDELDESNPLGVALHHEGPFQVIASVLKAPHVNPSPYSPPHMRAPRAPKPLANNGGSLGISPGQILPRNFTQLYHPSGIPPQSTTNRNYNMPPQASTSYLPPQQLGHPLHNTRHSPTNQRNSSRLQQQPYYPHPQPTPLTQHVHLTQDAQTSYIPTQYDPLDVLHEQKMLVHADTTPMVDTRVHPPGSHSVLPSEDNSDAYGGIEVDPSPQQERYSAPPVPSSSRVDPYAMPQDHTSSSEYEPRRHTVQNPLDFNAANQPPIPHSRRDLASNSYPQSYPNGRPVNSGYDPRLVHNSGPPNARQSSSGIHYNPQSNGQHFAPQQPHPPQSMGYNPEQDRRRPASHQPAPTPYNNYSDERNRPASFQPVPRAAPVDLARQEYDRAQKRHRHLEALAKDRPQSVNIAPSIATTNNPSRRLPQHTPKHLVMPTPLQQNSPLPGSSPARAYPNGHYESPNSSQTRLPLKQAQPITRAQTIQMDGNRHLLKKRTSVAAPPAPVNHMPPKVAAPTRQRSYMEPPPTIPGPPISRPMHDREKKPKRLLSKRRSDF
ncbi:hypothetical protein R3P38DRAFT_2824182 [Favolaschia claudopus]|uniref:Uncharacterized protein n=1 Tax=Favolaschia claudopus TaxID=2862362 RepID=A0AAW0EHX9_9AGAR